MKIEAVCIKVKDRPYTNQKGVTTTYFDAAFMDAEADPLKRFPGMVHTKPQGDDVKTFNICQGARLTLHITKVLELRNGDPVVEVTYEVPGKKA